MRDNGLPTGWSEATIGHLIGSDGVFVDGDWIETKDQDPTGDVRLIQLADVGDGIYRDKSNRYLTRQKAVELGCTFLDVGDILIARMPDPLGRACVFPGDPRRAVTAVDVCIVRTDTKGVNNKWLMHTINSLEIRTAVSGLQSGSTRKRISRSNLATIKFPVPPLAEQHRIVAKIEELFTQLDAGIQELRKARAQLKRYRQAVLKAAVTGELTNKWRERTTSCQLVEPAQQAGSLLYVEPAEELLVRILKERRAKWEADQLAKMAAAGKTPKSDDWKKKYREPIKPKLAPPLTLPNRWSWATWEQLGFSQNGRLFPSIEYQAAGVKLLRPGNLHESGKVVWNDRNTRHMPAHWAEEFPEYMIKGQELVMNLTAQSLRDEFLGRICLTDATERCLLNQRLARLTPIQVSRKYLLYVFKSEMFRRFVNTLNTGSLIQHMFTSQLAEFSLPLPSLEEQDQIVAEVERCLSIVDVIEQNLERGFAQAERMRQSILKQALEGKLVPQDPNDEPAELLLERIKIDRAKREAVRRAANLSRRKRKPTVRQAASLSRK